MLNLSFRINGLLIEGSRDDKLPKGLEDGNIVMAMIDGIMLGFPGSANDWKVMNEFGDDIIHPLKSLCKELPERKLHFGQCRLCFPTTLQTSFFNCWNQR
jgi:hypothetical protein